MDHNDYTARPASPLGRAFGITQGLQDGQTPSANASSSAVASASPSASSDEDDDFERDADTERQPQGGAAKQLLLRARARIESRLRHGVNHNGIGHNSSANNGDYNSALYYGVEKPIGVLPPEVLCLIFSYINSKGDLLSVALTCKYWAELIVELIWFRPGISGERVYKRLGKVMEKPRDETYWDYRLYIKRLNLSLVPSIVTNRYLDMFQGCQNLERITLVNCTHVGSGSVASLLHGCGRLQSIDLTGVRDIRDDIYEQLGLNCKRLQGLYAPGSFNVTKPAVLQVIQCCPLLKRVKLSDCPGVDDEVLLALVSNCPNLVEIDLHGCDKITNVALHEMFATLEFLKEFKISKNENVTGACFDSTDGSELCLDRLRIIDFTQCPNIADSAIEKFVSLAPRLRNVVLSKCTAITDRSLRAIATLGKSLHYVHLGHCSNITDFGARELIKSCYRLQYIDLACCTQLTNATVVELAQLPKLKRIGLVKCSQITDEGILALAENSRTHEDNLERVHLSYCMNLTIYPIYRLLKAFPKLTHISLTGVAQFLRHDITQFCRDPPQEFNPHQKSIFCVFSGEGVNQLRVYLTQLIETPQDPEREINELLDIINSVTDGVSSVDDTLLNADPLQRQRLRVFVDTLDRFINDYHGMRIPRENLELFAKCVFTRLPAVHVPRIQRFFQILQNHPLQLQPRRQPPARQTTQIHQAVQTTQATPAPQVPTPNQMAGQPQRQPTLLQNQRLQPQQLVQLSEQARVQAQSQAQSQPDSQSNSEPQSRSQAQYETRLVGGVHREFAIPRTPVEAELFRRQQYGQQQQQFGDEQSENRTAEQGGRNSSDPDEAMEDL
ncbi:DEKNAAC100622 [Brettanomyces naardenensis]|uniref:DEKNAAC100622 n=1 Tax=Brettanomyces naardenensis TaxID=13370 RepID=A0A448YFG1_BRENA|nr:DEKNAAC100622 [Brettanomyces naardenensis]